MLDHLSSTTQWIIFGVIVVILLGVDLFAHRKDKVQSMKVSVLWTLFWISLALLFNLFVLYEDGKGAALDYLTAYLLEKSLSIDNIFVFILIFGYFNILPSHQHRVLFWGILGALALRAVFIFLGAEILHQFEWVMFIFGAFLLYSGASMIFKKNKDEEFDPDKNFMVKLAKRFFKVSNQQDVPHFFVKEDGQTKMTSLFLCLLCIEVSDLIFAVDSVPAVLSVSQDIFIVYTSNIFAILGLRSLYFVLNGVMSSFYYLKYALAGILSFIGLKMVLNEFCKMSDMNLQISNVASLLVIVTFLSVAIVASVWRTKRQRKA
ncbi:MAG: TerC family protein [Bacteroidales bacterium]|nr:TerC family protein [Bacteroidales bacterium]